MLYLRVCLVSFFVSVFASIREFIRDLFDCQICSREKKSLAFSTFRLCAEKMGSAWCTQKAHQCHQIVYMRNRCAKTCDLC